jgi:hypothetical protein
MMSISSSGRVSVKGTNTTDYDGLLFSGTYNTAGDSFEFGGEETNQYDIPTVIYFDDIRVYNTELTSSQLNDVYVEFIQPSNLALRATFEDTTVYINPDTNASGAMTVGNNNFEITTSKSIQGTKSGVKSSTSRNFRISNCITGPYTITFWVFSPFTGATCGRQAINILSPGSTLWAFEFNVNDGRVGVSATVNGSTEFFSTGIYYTNMYNRWVMMSISSSGRVSIKGINSVTRTLISYYDGLIGTTPIIGSDVVEFGGNSGTDVFDAIGMYFDDIRVYNTELTSIQLNDVYNSYTKPSNLALRATFEDTTVYINPDNNVSGAMTIQNTLLRSTFQSGNYTGYKSSSSNRFRISNFITGPYTITFFVYITGNANNDPGPWNNQTKYILTPDRYIGPNTWSIELRKADGTLGVNAAGLLFTEFYSTGISYTQIYNRWVMMSISSSGRVSVKGTSTTDYDGLLFSGTYNTAGDSFELSKLTSSEEIIATTIYDDIRVYNTELTSAELSNVYSGLV